MLTRNIFIKLFALHPSPSINRLYTMQVARNKKGQPSKGQLLGSVMACALGLHFNAIIGMFFTPFLYRMVKEFGKVTEKSKAGYYAGYITGGYYFGRLLMSPMWGKLLDTVGRKTCLLVSLTLTCLLNVFFTWSSYFWLSVFAIFLVGLSNGLTTICKTLSTEIVPKNLHSWSVALTSSFWLLGNSVGPFVGSYFLDVIPSSPFLMSGIAVSCIGVIALLLSVLFVKETLKKKKPGYEQFDAEEAEAEETKPQEISLDVSGSFQSIAPQNEAFFHYIKRKSVIPLIVINNINLFCTTTLGDTLPLWLSAHHADGGLDLEPKSIGNIFAVLGPFQLLIQTVLYPTITRLKGDLWLLKVTSTLMIPIYFLLPAANRFFDPHQELASKIYVSSLLGFRYLCLFVIFSSMQKITNNSVRGDMRGKVNGIAQTTASIMQIIGSYLGSVLIAWSMNNGLLFPFNHYFLFILLAIISSVSLVFFVYRLQLEEESITILDKVELKDVSEAASDSFREK